MGDGPVGGAPGFGWELALLVSGSAALLVAPMLPIVDPDAADPAFTAEPLLAVLALLPVAVVLGLLARGWRVAALGLIVGLGVLGPARALADAQLFSDPNRAARPELLVPDSLTPLDPGIGAVLLMVGHGLLLLGAVVAVVRWGRRTEAQGAVPGMEFDAAVDRRPGRQGLLAGVLCLGAVAGVGLLSAPFHSEDPYLVGESALDAPAAATAGGVALAALTPVVAWLLASSPDAGRAAGGVLGVALAVFAVVVPPLGAVLWSDDIAFASGPLVAAAAVVAMVVWAVHHVRRGEPDGPSVAEDQIEDPTLPGAAALQRVAGAVAVIAGLVAFGGWAFDAINSDDGLAAPTVGAARLLIPAAILVGVLGALLLAAGPPGGALRPVLAVSLVAVPMAAAPVLDAGLTARDYSGLEVGAGSWLSLVAMPVAGLAALLASVAGGVERDDVDMSLLVERGPDRPVLFVAMPAAALAVLAFVLPLVDAPGYEAVAVWYGNGIASWGPVVAMAAVLVAIGLAPWSRPTRAAGLLVGAALVLGMRVLQYALVERRVDGAEVDAGLWVTVAAVVVVLVAAGVAARPQR